MKIKAKLTLAVGILFLMIILLAVIGIFSINALKRDTESILKSNYNTIAYSKSMLAALDESQINMMTEFEVNLKKQESNITELGELEATQLVRTQFEKIKANTNDSALYKSIRKEIFKLIEMNMTAISIKSKLATITAEKAVSWIAITGTVCFLVAFVLLINLPSNIANPIQELTLSIKQIADKNYAERVHFESNSEFGQLAKSFNTMAEKLEEYNDSNLAKLMMEKKRIETLINNMHDPVIGLDENLKVIFVNNEAIKISGLQTTNLIGKYAQDLAVNNDLIRMLIQDLVATETKNEPKSEPIKIFADNKEGYFEKETLYITITPTGEENPQLIGHVILLRNVTSYKELDFAKTNFIATVSHELKTPISSIKMSLQLLENIQIGNLNEEQHSLVNGIKDDAEMLLKITGELLNMTQVESGTIQMTVLPSDAKEIVDYAIHTNKIAAEQKHITIETQADDNLPQVLADNEKTAWVLTNLISNAIRYSHENSKIIISLTVNSQLSTLNFSVKDNGQGISPQYIHKVFDRYFRIPGTKKEGTGLGLSISKEFIEAQNGQISVESEIGVGSIFTVSLPVYKV